MKLHLHEDCPNQSVCPSVGGSPNGQDEWSSKWSFRERETVRPMDGEYWSYCNEVPQLLMILELYLELSYSLSQIFIVATVTEVT